MDMLVFSLRVSPYTWSDPRCEEDTAGETHFFSPVNDFKLEAALYALYWNTETDFIKQKLMNTST